MMAIDRLSALSWEPRIMKHTYHYDDPWQRERMAGGMPFKQPIQIIVRDHETNSSQVYPSLVSLARELGIYHQTIRSAIKNKSLLMKRYSVSVLDTYIDILVQSTWRQL